MDGSRRRSVVKEVRRRPVVAEEERALVELAHMLLQVANKIEEISSWKTVPPPTFVVAKAASSSSSSSSSPLSSPPTAVSQAGNAPQTDSAPAADGSVAAASTAAAAKMATIEAEAAPAVAHADARGANDAVEWHSPLNKDHLELGTWTAESVQLLKVMLTSRHDSVRRRGAKSLATLISYSRKAQREACDDPKLVARLVDLVRSGCLEAVDALAALTHDNATACDLVRDCGAISVLASIIVTEDAIEGAGGTPGGAASLNSSSQPPASPPSASPSPASPSPASSSSQSHSKANPSPAREHAPNPRRGSVVGALMGASPGLPNGSMTGQALELGDPVRQSCLLGPECL